MTQTPTPDEAGQRRLPTVALVLAAIIGPLGASLGTWLALRARREGKRIPGLAAVAVAVGVVQTATVAVLFSTFAPAAPPLPGNTPSPSRTYPSWPTPTQITIAAPTPERPLPTSLPSYVPTKVGPYQAASAAPDQGSVDKGATNASTATYGTGKKAVRVVTAEWPSADAAAAYAKAQAAATFPGADARLTAPIPSGSMSLYAADGQATIYCYQGTFSMVITGEQEAVEEFFSQFPV